MRLYLLIFSVFVFFSGLVCYAMVPKLFQGPCKGHSHPQSRCVTAELASRKSFRWTYITGNILSLFLTLELSFEYPDQILSIESEDAK